MSAIAKDVLTQEINDIIKSRTQFMGRNYPKIRDAYKNHYDWPEMDALRHEICICLLFGLHQASITLTNHFLESLLKNALITYDAIRKSKTEPTPIQHTVESFVSLFRTGRKEYGSSDLSKNINRACSLGLITKDQKKALHEIRDLIRNPYSHADKENLFGNQNIPVQSVRVEEGKFIAEKPENANLAELTIAHGLAQAMQAEEEAVPYFLDLDGLTREIREKLFGPVRKGGGGPDDSAK